MTYPMQITPSHQQAPGYYAGEAFLVICKVNILFGLISFLQIFHRLKFQKHQWRHLGSILLTPIITV